MAERGDDSADLIEFIAKAMVSQPEEVNVVIEDDGDLIELETADGDRGRVIGRQGRVQFARAGVMRIPAGDDAAPGRTATACGQVGPRKQHPFTRQLVDVGRLNDFTPVATEITGGDIIREIEDEIRPCLRIGSS